MAAVAIGRIFFCFQHLTRTYFSQPNYSTCAACPARGVSDGNLVIFGNLISCLCLECDQMITYLFLNSLAFLNFFELFWIFTSCRLVGHVLLVFCLECHQMIVQLISCDFSTFQLGTLLNWLVLLFFSSNLLIFVPPNFNFTSGPIVPGCGCYL